MKGLKLEEVLATQQVTKKAVIKKEKLQTYWNVKGIS